MGFYAKLVERELEKRRRGEREEICRPYEEKTLTEAEWREIKLKRARPDYSRESMLAAFKELRGLKNKSLLFDKK